MVNSCPLRKLFFLIALMAAAGEASAQYRIDRFTTSNGLPQNTVSSIAQTPDGYLWFATYDGLVRYDGVRFTIFDRGNSDGFVNNQLLRIIVNADGTLWIDTSGGPMRYAAGKFSAAERRQLGANVPGPEHGDLMDAGTDRTGGVWRYGRDRLIRDVRGDVTVYDAAELLQSRFIRTMFIDREGVIWIGTNANGLYRLTPRFLTAYGEAQGISEGNVYPVLEDRHGTIWTGANNFLYRHANGRFLEQLLDLPVRSLYEDRRGRLLVGGGGAVVVVENGRPVDRFTVPGAGFIDTMIEDSSGVMWFGTPRGLFRQAGSDIRHFTRADGLPDDGINVLLIDRQERLWAGTRNGIARFESGPAGEGFKAFTARDGVGAGRVRALYEDRDGIIWIGTFESGITRLKDGRFATINTRAGLYNNGAFHIIEDERGNFWVSCNRGIYRVSRQQLNGYADGRIAAVSSVAYGSQDGMLSAEANGGRQPAGVKSRGGSIWFPTQGGLIQIEPKAVVYNTAPPPVVIEDVRVDGSPASFSGGLRIAPGQTNLEIAYTAPSSLKAEHIHFKYTLDGLTSAWVDAGTRRAVTYSHLPPGTYTFRVIAANSDGVSSAAPAEIRVRVDPFFYQTWWFAALCLAALAALTAGGYMVRVRRLLANENRLKALVAERTSALQVANAQLHALATADSLTGVANRRRFSDFLEQEWHRAQRARTPVSLLMLDVDHFKKFNDTYGHAAGDDCLKRVAAILTETVSRSTDLVSRYGGEEFAVLLTDTDARGAELVAETIRERVESAGIEHKASPSAGCVTVSVGIATVIPDPAVDPSALMRKADEALYRAKETGRNRVFGAATEPS